MRTVLSVLLLIVGASSFAGASEVPDVGPLRPSDWRLDDRVQYNTDSVNLTLEQLQRTVASYAMINSFIQAFLVNLRNQQAREYTTVSQRHSFYDYATFLLESATTKPEISKVRFFHATTVVTGWSAIGVVDNDSWNNPIVRQVGVLLPNESDRDDTFTLLRAINAALFAKNLPIINKLLNSWNEPRDPKNSTKPLSALEFDLAMVDFEQNNVQDELSRRRPRPETLKTIASLMRFRSGTSRAFDNIGDGNPLDIAARWAQEAGYSPYDFAGLSNRVALGRALVFYYHLPDKNQSLGDAEASYKAYMQSHGSRQPASVADDDDQWQSWTAGQSILISSDARGIVPALYAVATREALAKPAGTERQAVIDDFATAVRGARDIHTFADYQKLLDSPVVQKYSAAQALPSFSTLGVDSLNQRNAVSAEPAGVEKLYRSKITIPVEPSVILAAGRMNPAAGDVISSLSKQVFDVPASASEWNWDVLKTAPAFAKQPAAAQLRSLMQSPNASLPSALSTVAATMDNAALKRATDAVTSYQRTVDQFADVSTMVRRFQIDGLPSTDLDADVAAVQSGARGVAAVAQLFGDEGTAKEAVRVADTVGSSVKVFQAAKLLLASGSTAGAFLAVGGLTSALDGLFGGSSSDSAVLDLLHDMFNYMKTEFGVVNQKLNDMVVTLDGIQASIKTLQIGIDEANNRLELTLAALGRIEASLADIKAQLNDVENQELDNCIGYSRDNATFRSDANGELSRCVSRYLDLLRRAKTETLALPNTQTPQDATQFQDKFVAAASANEQTLEIAHAASLLSALATMEASVNPNLPASSAVNAEFMWQAVTGLSVFDHDFASILPWTAAAVSEIKGHRSDIVAVDAMIKSLGGDNAADRIARTKTLHGSISAVSEPSRPTTFDLNGSEPALTFPKITVADPSASSYAAALGGLNQVLSAAGDSVIGDTVAALSTRDGLNGRIFDPVSFSCPDNGSFTNAIYRRQPLIEQGYAKDHFPPIYFTQGGASGPATYEWSTYGSVTGPVQVCVGKPTVTYPVSNLLCCEIGNVTAKISVRFAGHVLQEFTNVIKLDSIARGLDPVTLWFSLQSGSHARWRDGSDNFLDQLENVLKSHQDQAARYVGDVLRARIVLRDGGGSTWFGDVRDAGSNQGSTVRGRFLRDLVKKLQQPGSSFGVAMQQTIRQLDIEAAILRVHAAVVLPDFVEMADPLRVLLVGEPGSRLFDGDLVSHALQCVSDVPDSSKCDKRISDVIGSGFFERAGAGTVSQLNLLNNTLSSLPVNDRLNTGHPYLETLGIRFDALIGSIESKLAPH